MVKEIAIFQFSRICHQSYTYIFFLFDDILKYRKNYGLMKTSFLMKFVSVRCSGLNLASGMLVPRCLTDIIKNNIIISDQCVRTIII